ncbi:prephenate dehydrogenase [Aquimarina muelleri]|uniref:Prephenate dehydrogenase n=1 Tax=Aquimarina muelleri TaxID=279356 RepID=A0A918JRN3_9FLAO|nr:prephenate dehydrogenase [Aquimarina muelleri]MCX2763157.1 prephenate dehydrogenase [Aquimarina muelleri]GGX06203.1 prephenate dehydrogenase [Aquimarina muelleri]
MNVFVIGVGLIGGSFAIDIKATFNEAMIYGVDKNEENLKQALSLGFIDCTSDLESLEKADIVIVAIPVDATVEILSIILDKIGDDCLVFDAGSTKKKLCETIERHHKRRNYLATHPIAGTEFSGPQAAIANLYRGKTNIICEVEKTAFKLQEKGMEIFSRLGMRIRYMDPGSHDKHIAYVSHLSHISSFMLGKTVIEKEKNERDIFDMAGSGFASTVRLAKSSPDMWTPIFKQNKENILETLKEYIANLTHFKGLIENEDFLAIHKEMEETNYIKTILKGIA